MKFQRIWVLFVVWIAALSVPTHRAFALRDAIVAAWTMDEGSGKTVRDVTGNGHDGEIVDGVDWVKGKFGGALRFDGATGYVQIPYDKSLHVMNQGDFTLTAWFQLDAAPATNNIVFQQADSGGTGRTWLFVHSAAGEIRSYLGGGPTQSGVTANPGEWYHVAVVVTENGGTDTIQLFVNGEPSGAAGQLGIEDSAGDFFIGRHKNPSNYWTGTIDEVALLDKAVDQAEVEELMNNGIAAVLPVADRGEGLPVRWGALKRAALTRP